ncbi:MAG: hypothetical protein P4L53_19765 [Candidatus Obscuribacterales bacterium]|nr:hypothetical protein [Candidatus Obscuribacterales bacterium]
MCDKNSITVSEWKLLLQLLERERAELPPEIHHSELQDTKLHLRDRLRLVDELMPKLQIINDSATLVGTHTTCRD